MRQQARHRGRGRRLARAGLADDADDLAAPQLVVDATDGANVTGGAGERHPQIADGEDGVVGHDQNPDVG